MAVLGIDVGASKIHYLVLDGEQRLREGELPITTPTKEDFMEICQKIRRELEEGRFEIGMVGIGLPGTVEAGVLTAAPNFPALSGWPAEKELSALFQVPVKAGNDAKAFVLAEARQGAGRGFKNIIGLTLGSGLGGGLYLNGALYLGQGTAGEVGHEIIDLKNQREAEEFVSAKFFRQFGEDANSLREKAEAGDEAARQAFQEFGRNLGVVTANLVNLLDPEAIIVGGGIAGAARLFMDTAQETAAKFIINPDRKKIPILTAALGPAAGAIGAALFLD